MNETPNPYATLPSVSADASSIERSYLSRLKQYRLDGGPNPISYLGSKWFFMKVLLAGLAAWILIGHGGSLHVGWLLVGYLVGTVTASIKTLLSLRRLWPYQNAITDWSVVDERLGE